VNLTTTSYAILGQLALRPWTAYDLATQMRTNLHYFFPRAESQVYAEPKRLVALGLATAHKEATGRRSRVEYRITDAGSLALEQWLGTPLAKGPVLEFEALLRVIYAPFGRDSDLVATLAQVRDEVDDFLDLADRVRDDYVAGRMPFQRHVVQRSIMHDFLASFADLVDEWAERSAARVDQWPSQTEQERVDEAIETIRRVPRRRTTRLDDARRAADGG
jgi:DNA-binding PadR family transcriptional regulator